MSTTKVWVSVDRAAALRRGINGTDSPVQIELDVTKMNAEDRAEVADRFAVHEDNRATSHLPTGPYLRERLVGFGLQQRHMTVVEPSQAGVLAAFAAYRQLLVDEAAKQAAKVQADIDEGLANLHGPAKSQQIAVWVKLDRAEFRVHTYEHGDCTAKLRVEYERQYCHSCYGDEQTRAACKLRCEQLDAETEQRKQDAIAAAKSQLAEQYLQPAYLWIVTHGSYDLRRMVQESMDWWPLYESERAAMQAKIDADDLASDYPGWVAIDDSEQEISDPVNPSARAWAILDAARSTDSGGSLGPIELGMIGDSYVAHAQFRGRTIIWPAD